MFPGGAGDYIMGYALIGYVYRQQQIKRLADEKKLAVAGPLDGVDGWRGLFVFATPDIELAKTYVATDPVIISGEMVAEYHKFFSSAGLMMVGEIHDKIMKK